MYICICGYMVAHFVICNHCCELSLLWCLWCPFQWADKRSCGVPGKPPFQWADKRSCGVPGKPPQHETMFIERIADSTPVIAFIIASSKLLPHPSSIMASILQTCRLWASHPRSCESRQKVWRRFLRRIPVTHLLRHDQWVSALRLYAARSLDASISGIHQRIWA